MLRLLSLKRVAEALDVSEKTVRRWVRDGQFPGPTHTLPGGNLRWEEDTVKGWLAVHSAAFAVYSQGAVKGKVRGTNADNAGHDGTSDGQQAVGSKSRL